MTVVRIREETWKEVTAIAIAVTLKSQEIRKESEMVNDLLELALMENSKKELVNMLIEHHKMIV